MTTLEIQARDKSVENNALRKSGFLPAVVYGKKTPSTPITISQKDFLKVWKEAGESGVVQLKGAPGNFDALIHDISWGPILTHQTQSFSFVEGKAIETRVYEDKPLRDAYLRIDGPGLFGTAKLRVASRIGISESEVDLVKPTRNASVIVRSLSTLVALINPERTPIVINYELGGVHKNLLLEGGGFKWGFAEDFFSIPPRSQTRVTLSSDTPFVVGIYSLGGDASSFSQMGMERY